MSLNFNCFANLTLVSRAYVQLVWFLLSFPLLAVGASQNDTSRAVAVDAIMDALESYGEAKSTYVVGGGGSNGGGLGWFHYDNHSRYPVSIADALIASGHLSSPAPTDPLQTNAGLSAEHDFLVYRCKDRIAVFSESDGIEPTATDSQWWSANSCTRFPIDTFGRSYFVLSQDLELELEPKPEPDLDPYRISALQSIMNGLELYGEANGTYAVGGGGSNGGGLGWFHYDNHSRYPVSIADALIASGHLSSPAPTDPLQTNAGLSAEHDFLVYRCKDRIAVFSESDGIEPTATDSQWWSANSCTRFPIDTFGRSYFVLSQDLEPEPEPDLDPYRISALQSIMNGFELYGEANGTYAVGGGGSNGGGLGWFHYDNHSRYPVSIADVLIASGHLSSPAPTDPLQTNAGLSAEHDFLVYRCKDRVAVFSESDGIEPTAPDSQWWSANSCTRFPIDTFNRPYFVLSQALYSDPTEPVETPSAPTPLAPLAEATINASSTVIFTWQPVPLAGTYEFLLTDSTTMQSVSELTGLQPSVVCSDELCIMDVIVELPVAQQHAWSIRARNSAGVSDYSRTEFNVVQPITEPPEPLVIIAPLAGANEFTESQISFSWQPTLLASSYEFELIGSASMPIDSNLTIPAVVPSSSCDESECTILVTLNLPGGATYPWRVRAINSVGASSWTDSTIYAIESSAVKPSIPIAISPAANTDLIVGNTTVFQWQHDPQVVVYDFHFFNNAPTVEGVLPKRGALPNILDLRPQDICVNQVCEYEVLVDIPVFENHAWRVRARNSLGNLGWSRTSFNAVEIVTEAPLGPVLVSPIVNALLETTTSAQFTWEPVDTATLYEFELLNTSLPAFDPISAFIPAAQCSVSACNVSVTLDVDVDPNYRWQVRARNAVGPSAWVGSDIEVINLATQIPPVTINLLPEPEVLLTAGDTVNFTWARDPHAVTYEFHFFDNVEGTTTPYIIGLKPDELCDASTCELSQVIDLAVAESHAWRVRGRNSLGAPFWSRSLFDVVEPVTEPPGPFTLNQPILGGEVQQGSAISFVWSHALRAASYEIVIVDGTLVEPLTSPITVSASTCDDEVCRYTSTSTLPLSTDHSWQVRAINPIGTSDWLTSSFAVVETVIEPPSTPVIIAPLAQSTVISGQSVDFQWQADSEANNFEFYITDAINGVQEVVADLQPSALCSDGVCTFSTEFALPVSDLHTWHVRVRRADDAVSDWSQTAIRVVEDTGTGEPTASFSIAGFSDNAIGLAPLSLSFDPTASHDDVGIVSYTWDFGDGSTPLSTDSAQIVDHSFAAPGNYTVSLTVTDAAELSASTDLMVTTVDPANAVSAEDASRLLTQATFGPTAESILQVQALGIENWIDQQFARQGPAHLPYVQQYSNNSNRAARHEVWWTDVVTGEDQLRQRVAFALSQIFVVSDTGYTLGNAQYGITNYYDMLRDNAFGNYRDLLESVTLSPVMGLYLSMLQNAKSDEVANTRADENYAREVLQLFSIGLYQLNNDGTTTDSHAFNQNQVEAFARAFTGWNYADAGRWDRKPFTGADLISPMRPFEAYHDLEPKALLNNQTSPANQSARQDLDFALDNIFNHANVGPFMAKQLIKRLVTSNPSAAYIDRVASVFNDDGLGVRGNLQAVVRALLLDEEARTIPSTQTYGKLREPVLRISHLWRAFNVIKGSQSVRGEFNTTSPQMENLDDVTGQAILRSPSVFNFFQPSYSPAGSIATQNLVAPEFELFTESNELATSNLIGRQIQVAFLSNSASNARTGSHLDFTFEISIADDVDQLLEHLNRLLVSGNLRPNTLTTLAEHLNGIPDTATGHSERVRDAVTLIMASPDYLIQK